MNLIKNLNKDSCVEMFRFICSGLGSVLIDFLVYMLLQNYINISLAKGFSFICGAFFSYLVNNIWTFRVSKIIVNNLIKFSVLYFFSFILNISVNYLFFIFFENSYISFFFATLASTTINFIGMKFWVFKK
jgi:putative flippase GtrA